jgi:hypothetical protein
MNENGQLFVKYRARISGPFTADEITRQANQGLIGPLHRVSADQQSWLHLHELPRWKYLEDNGAQVDTSRSVRPNAAETPPPSVPPSFAPDDDEPMDVELLD